MLERLGECHVASPTHPNGRYAPHAKQFKGGVVFALPVVVCCQMIRGVALDQRR